MPRRLHWPWETNPKPPQDGQRRINGLGDERESFCQLILRRAPNLRQKLLHQSIHLRHGQNDDWGAVWVLLDEYLIVLKDCHKLEGERHELENRNHNLSIQLRREKDAFEGRINDLQNEHHSKTQSLVTELSRLEDEIYGLKTDKRKLESKHKDDVQQLEDYGTIIRQMHTDHQTEKTDMQTAHQGEMQRRKEDYEARISQIHMDHRAEMTGMQARHDAEKSRIKTAHDAEISEKQRKFDSEKDQMRRDFNAKKVELESQQARIQTAHDAERKRLEGEISEKQRKCDSEKDQMRRDFNAKKVELESRHATEQSRMESDFKVEKLRLENERATQEGRMRKDIESLNAHLLTRDRFTPIVDHELKARFLDLVNDVDYLARLEWKFNQTDWTNQLLGRLSTNQRRLKKQILQDSLWITLYENIFCSPFRIFGEEGRTLEAQWNEAFGKDSNEENGFYTWPKPSMGAERWRYETIKPCQEALDQPVSDWAPRAKLKKAFKSSLDNIKKELSDTLGRVSNLDENTLQALEDVPKKAAKMWIEMGTQRCRIVLVMPGSTLEPQSDRVRKAREDFLELVVVPELRRFGNSKGENLDKEETIMGCEGNTVQVSSR